MNLELFMKTPQGTPRHLVEAEALFRRVLAGNEAQLGPTDPRTLNTVNSLAVVLRKLSKGDKHKLSEAEVFARRALEGEVFGILGGFFRLICALNICIKRMCFSHYSAT